MDGLVDSGIVDYTVSVVDEGLIIKGRLLPWIGPRHRPTAVVSRLALFAFDHRLVISPMPSLFSRTRPSPSPLRSQKSQPSDEFGRVPSHGSPWGTATVPGKKDKNPEKSRTRTLSAAKGRAPGLPSTEDEPIIPDGSFFPLNLDPHGDVGGAADSERGACSFRYLSLLKRPRGRGRVLTAQYHLCLAR